MSSTDFDRQLQFVEALRESNARVLLAHSGNDFLIEPEISKEFVATFEPFKELVIFNYIVFLKLLLFIFGYCSYIFSMEI